MNDRLTHAISPHLPRIALVTGGGKRLGRAIALALADAGFGVGIHFKDSAAEAEATAAEIRAAGGAAAIFQADLALEADVRHLLPRVAERLGPIGVLVNNASVFERDSWNDVTRESWDGHIEPNLRAPFTLMQAFADALPAQREGVIINMLDQRVWSLTQHFVSYTVSKAGLWALTQSMALALAPRIRVAAIGPGPALPNARQSNEQFARQAESVPLGHGTGEAEIGLAALMILALPSFTGQMMALDGGQHLQWGPSPGGLPSAE